MILIEFLFAPTVPSEPSPQNLQQVVPSGVELNGAASLSESLVTSSSIPIVNFCLLVLAEAFAYTAAICSGVVFLLPRP